MVGTAAKQPSVGRPRRLDPDTEVRLLMDAAFALLKRNDYEDVSVVDILSETGLSTRSFYRHFATKDDLLLAMYLENAEAAAARVSARVARANGARERLEAWVDAILGFGYDAGKVERVKIFRAAAAGRARVAGVDLQQAQSLLLAPLVEVLDAGVADGSFTSPDTTRDARAIYALAWQVVESVREKTDALPRADARRHVLRFALPALGVAG